MRIQWGEPDFDVDLKFGVANWFADLQHESHSSADNAKSHPVVLERPDFQDVLRADASGDVIVVAVRTRSETTGVDVSLAFSTDAGDTWAWGGTLQLPGEQVPQGIMITPQGAVVVGETRAGEADPKAFMATAAAPNFDLVAMTLPEEFAGAISLRDIALAQSQWVIVGLGRDDASFANRLIQRVMKHFLQFNTALRK